MFQVKIRCLNVTIWFTQELRKSQPKETWTAIAEFMKRGEVVLP